MTPDLEKLQKILNYHFKDSNLVLNAIVHPGLKKKHQRSQFETLEFLGDRVLGLSLADMLFRKFGHGKEGELAVRMAALAGTEFLIELAKRTEIISCFSIPKDFFVSHNKTSSAIADMMEAVFAAIYLDSDFSTVKNIISELWSNDISKVVYKKKDPKSLLQEVVQAKGGGLPVYRLVKMTGAAHDPVFEIEVHANNFSTLGYGNSKKMAEHDAAEKMLKKIKG